MTSKRETLCLSKILTENSTYTNVKLLKKRLLESKLLQYRCYNLDCGITSWLGKSLSLQIDHINGHNNDHRLENLRLLCPNCHSQTDTYCGRNKKSKKKALNCPMCFGPMKYKKSKSCSKCYQQHQKTKIDWPSHEILTKMIDSSNIFQVAKQLGVSSHSVKNRLMRAAS